MRFIALLPLLMLILTGCTEKKSDLDLFDEGKVKISLSASQQRGYPPLFVSITGYLENRERQIEKEITQVKWVLKGPDNYLRDIIQESANYQEEEENKNDTFYFEQTFYRPGNWRGKLVLNDGEFTSRFITIKVLEDRTTRRD